MSRWEYKIRGYAGNRHPVHPRGTLLLETVHATEGSRDIEIAAWKRGMARGEVSHIEVFDLNDPKMIRIDA